MRKRSYHPLVAMVALNFALSGQAQAACPAGRISEPPKLTDRSDQLQGDVRLVDEQLSDVIGGIKASIAIATLEQKERERQIQAHDAADDEAARECHDFKTASSAVTGGFLLWKNIAGRNALGIVGLLLPFAFKNCSTSSTVPIPGSFAASTTTAADLLDCAAELHQRRMMIEDVIEKRQNL